MQPSPPAARDFRGIARNGAAVAISILAFAAGVASAQTRGILPQRERPAAGVEQKTVNLDMVDREITDVIQLISEMTGKNFIYDDKVRGRVTIISPAPMPIEQAYAVFESVLHVKGFTTVVTPSGAIKVIPVREAKESNIDTVATNRPPPNRDTFVTRLIPLRFIGAESIVSTLKPLVSQNAAMVAYGPTNTVILTESASNIRRVLSILESIDVESYRDALTVIKIEHADAGVLADQISEIYGAQTGATATSATSRRARTSRRATTPTVTSTPSGRQVRILTDARTNSLIVLAARSQLEDIRGLVAKLDVPVIGGGRIHVYYLNHANAEELSQTLNALISGQPAASRGAGGGAGGAQTQQLRAVVSGLAEGLKVTADPSTNSLVIQASQEGYSTLQEVIAQLDIPRPQVLVEALIMEVDVTDASQLGFNGILRLVRDPYDVAIATATDPNTAALLGGAVAGPAGAVAGPFLASFLKDTITNDDGTEGDGTLIQSIIRASASNAGINIISAPHILTSDNEQAEIRIGDNIPIVSSRVNAATGNVNLSSSVNVERQDIGVTLRVTPQITEGNTLRLELFQELSAVNEALTDITGSAEEVGVALSNRRIENTVVVADGETIVIGGLISDEYSDTVNKVPFLGDIPIFGWLFKTKSKSLVKKNLLVFLTPHIVRNPADLEFETIRKRREFALNAGIPIEELEEIRAREEERREAAELEGLLYRPEPRENPLQTAILDHAVRYPLERMTEIEDARRALRGNSQGDSREIGTRYFLQAVVTGDEAAAMETLTNLVDAGYDGTLVSGQVGETILYEVRLGPYRTLEEAQRVGDTVTGSHGLAPTIVVGSGEGP
ncbi:MAG: type II secretion system secretin GspD [Myxococcota bacterium]